MKKGLKILVPIDFSVYGWETLEFALSLKDLLEPSFLLLHVVPSGEVTSFATLGGETPQSLSGRVREALQALEAEAERFREAHPGVPIVCQAVAGVPFREICRIAEEGGCRLIVIGTHGRTGLPHLLIGSTAERVVQHAPCPVLSIKPRML